MDRHTVKPRWPLAAMLLGIACMPAAAQAQEARSLELRRAHAGALVPDKEGKVQLFIQFSEPSVAEMNIQAKNRTGQLAPAAEQKAQAARVLAQQESMRSVLAAHGAQILSSQKIAANGLRVRVAPSEIPALKSLPGVRTVGGVTLQTVNNATSVPWIGAPEVWASSGQGEGVKIGIIDTGIDYTHANFGGSGDPADYAANDKNVVEPGSFPTAKVVGGFDFAGPTYNANVAGSLPEPDADPLDGNGHGSHVAGSAAGFGVTDSIGPGVAPGAQLYALKVFSDGGGSTDLTSLAIEWALDPNGDSDMSDHLDVINMSLGSSFGEPIDPSAISSSNAARLGIVVVASAGNENGIYSYITGAPATASEAISVAANTPGGRLYAKLTANSPEAVAGDKPTLEGAGPVRIEDVGPITDSLVPAEPALGCSPLTNGAAVSGNIALMIRGGCTFLTKYQNAQAAGAQAIVVYNSGPGAGGEDPIVMGGLDGTVTIPGVMTSFSAGSALASAAADTEVNVTLAAALDPSQDDAIAGFSSLGPGGFGSRFKPDIAAPGVGIVSTAVGTGSGSANFQGTSMAAPHVAGAAALLVQQRPNLRPDAIKALLQNSTADSNGDTRLSRQGVGALRIGQASALSSYATPGGVSFGRLVPTTPINRDHRVIVRNLADSARTFNVTHVPNRSYPGVEVSCPSVVNVRARNSARFNVDLTFDPAAAFAAGVGDNGFTSQSEVDGWCILSDGTDTLRVGYLAVVDAASRVDVTPDDRNDLMKVRNTGPALGLVEGFTLAKAGGELQDGTYGSIAATGFRRALPGAYPPGFENVLEVGLAVEAPFDHPSNLFIQIDADTDGDEVADVTLIASDFSNFADVDPGDFVTLQFGAGGGFADWFAIWDYNDRVMILPFTMEASGGFAPESFDYVMTVSDRSGNVDVQSGRIDLANEIVPDLNSFGLDPGGAVDVGVTGPEGRMLWLLQNNVPFLQPDFAPHRPN